MIPSPHERQNVTTACVFPGQGSQAPKMGEPWTESPHWGPVTETVSTTTGRNMARLLLEADQDELTATANAQLAMFTVGVLAWRTVRDAGCRPTLVAGHSLGEYTALHAAGLLELGDAANLVATRGDAMAKACAENPGTMAVVIGVHPTTIERECVQATAKGEQVWVANYNGPKQTVIAGTESGVDVVTVAVAAGYDDAQIIPIPVNGAFHTPLMDPAVPVLADVLSVAPFVSSAVPVVANVDGRLHRDPAEWPSLLTEQVTHPVQWTATLEQFVSMGVSTVVELGAATLTGMTKRAGLGLRPVAITKPAAVNKL